MLNLYTLKDVVADLCGNVVTCKNDDLIIRDFKNAAKRGIDDLEDKVLLRVGTFDEESGEIVACRPETVISGRSVLLFVAQEKSEVEGKANE